MSEEKPFYETFPAPLEGQVRFEGYKHSEIMVIELHHPKDSLVPRVGGWAYCLRCERKYQPRKPKDCTVPIRGTYQIRNKAVILRIQKKKQKKNHCLGCGRALNDKGEK